MLNTVTTCASPPRIWPTIAWLNSAMRTTTLAEVINSPTRRKNGIAISASVSIPLNSWVMIDGRLTAVHIVPMMTPAISANATGTPR